MDRTVFILKIFTDIIWYEFMWILVKKNKFKLSTVQMILKYLMGLNIFFLILIPNTPTFVNLYFMSLWYFVIYPQRIITELTEEQAKSIVAKP
jgi:hypothetical protein